jgi:uncharacterized protein YcaQ
MSWGGEERELFEYFWGHKAALIPLSTYPLLRWRMRAAKRQDWDGELDPELEVPWAVVAGMRRLSKERPGLVDDVLAIVAERGPIAARDASPDGLRRGASDPDPDPSTGRMWNWQDAKIALEYLFCTGRVTIEGRRNFERLYDLTERVLPADVSTAPELAPDQAQRELLRISARTLGVATARELCGATRGHFPLPAEPARVRIAELLEAGELLPVRVDGVPQQSYLWSKAREPREIQARALLSPFDSLIWNRDRAQRLFDFHYRISIYTPAAKRTDGYYVLPFLFGERLVARVDLAADRRRSALVVPIVKTEPGVRADEVVPELAAELELLAAWLELDRVVVTDKRGFGTELSRAVG